MVNDKKSVDDILRKYSAKIEGKINSTNVNKKNYSQEYLKFKSEMSPEFSKYERWCHSLGSVIKLNVSKKDEVKMSKDIEAAHLDIKPWQAMTLSVMSFVSVFFVGILISIITILIKGDIAAFPVLFFVLMIIFSLFLFYFVNGYPKRLAVKWRLKASSQMVPAILYIVVYMRHTPNLEKAISFASQHLQYPLSMDLKKVFYNVEIGKFSTIKESLDNYLETWRDYSQEFIESFHLIESSLFEPDNNRRISILEKSLQVVLDVVYDKMLKFTHNVRSPLTNVYMLGVVLPTLGLALLPLASAMLGGILTHVHVFILFNLIIPFFVFYLTDKIMLLRPGGYGESALLKKNPFYSDYNKSSHYTRAFLIVLPLLIIGLIPLFFSVQPFVDILGLNQNVTFAELGIPFFKGESIFGFIPGDSGVVGPFGFGALLMGMFFPLGIALFFSIAYKNKTKKLIIERNKTKDLEREFNSSLFQLGNRVGNGVPPELVFGKVAESSRGLKTEEFFKRVNFNIRQIGMSVEKAIFDPKRGAMIYFPSDLIATSMRVLIEASKKGLRIAALSLMSISEYIKNIDKITQRLRDMLAEIISDMKSNMTFLAPLLSGIVVGLAVMITSILSHLNLSELGGDAAGLGSLASLINIFEMAKMIPPYYLQIAVGIYIIEIIFILSGTLVSINSGEDTLQRISETGKNLKRGVLLYFIVAFVASLALFFLSSIVLTNLV